MTNIKTLRENAKLTHRQIGQFLGISPEEAEKIENGTKAITTVQLDKLCCLFQCSEECVLGLEESNSEQIDMSRFSAEEMNAVADIGRICNNIKLLKTLLAREEAGAETY